ncbi:MAG: hypothetical protein WBO37_05075 [Gammaproteobacteria bacterium]
MQAAALIAGCDVAYEVKSTPTYMCTGDELTVYADFDDKITRIRVFDNQDRLWAEKRNTRHITVTVPDIQPDEQLQFEVKAKKERRFAPDTKLTLHSDFQSFDNPAWVNGDGILPTRINYDTRIDSRDEEAGMGEMVCMQWDADGLCEEEQILDRNGTACYSVHEVYYKYQGANWTLRPGIDFTANRVKARKVKNMTSHVLTVQPGASNPVQRPNPGTTATFPPVQAGAVTTSLALLPEQQEWVLCKKLTLLRDCDEAGELNKNYMPTIESCHAALPVIDMELLCEQP